MGRWIDFGMKKSLLILTLFNIGLGQPSDSLINVHNYPEFQNLNNPKILPYSNNEVIVISNETSVEVTEGILLMVIDLEGSLVDTIQYQYPHNLIDVALAPDSSFIIAGVSEIWRLTIEDNEFDFSILANQFNGSEITSVSVNHNSTVNVTTTQASPSEILQFDLDGELVSSFNVYDAEQDTYVNESFVNHIKTSDGGFLFLSSNGQRIYKANYEGLLEWNRIYNIDYISDIIETNGEFILFGSYVDWYGDYDGCDYYDCAISILIDELGNEILNSVFSSATYFNSCIVIEDGYIFAGSYFSGGFNAGNPTIVRTDNNLELELSQTYFNIQSYYTDILRIDENRLFSVGIDNSPPNYSSTLSILHYYFEPLPELSNCIAEDGTDGVDLWGICYSIENTTNIFLTGPEIEDTIPPLIGNLVNLTSLEINWTEIHGNIPSEIGNLTNLTYLSLTGNFLSGDIPPEIGNLTNLTTLSLSDNGLSGSIPSELGNLINLTNLNFFDTALSGEIPPELGNLVNLNSLELHNNNLEGSIPSEIGNLINLTNLHLWNNYLEGDVPLGIWDLNNLVELDLSTNQLTGSISSNIGSMTNLELLGLGENQLNGLIPENICELELNEFESIDLEYNKFCPPYPSCIEDYLGEQDTSNCENVSVLDDLIPYTYKLYSAYPNPFNPFTTLRYDLLEDGLVNITIYDMLGNVINQLVNDVQNSGYKSIQWNATNNQGQPVSAGVYLYTIEAGDFRQTKKMILLK